MATIELSGKVTNQAGTDLEGLTVQLYTSTAWEAAGSTTATDTTDSDGIWNFDSVAQGTYVVVVNNADSTKKLLFDGRNEVQFTRVDIRSTLQTDTINEATTGTGVTIDSVVVKDGGLTTTGAIELGHATANTLTASSGVLSIEGNVVYSAGGTDVPVTDGGTGASTLTDGGVLLGSGTSAVTAMAVLADSEMIVGDGTTDPVAESGATLRTSIGVGTGDSPQFTGIELSHATANTLTASSGVLSIEGNVVYSAGGTDVPVADGGTGASSLTNGGVLLGSGTGAITAMSVLADSEMIVGDGTTDPVAESGTTLRTSIGVGTGDSPTFTGLTLSADIDMQGANIDNGGVLFLKEQADADADVAGSGQIWVDTATPNALFFTDDAGTDFNLSLRASATVSGPVELATTAETTTGDDATRAVTPDGLSQSVYGEKVIQMVCVDFATALTTGSKFYFHVPSTLNGFNIVHAHAETLADPSGATIIVDLHNATQSDAGILSGKLIIGIGEHGSDESGGSHTVDGGQDDLQTNDVIRVDIDQIGSGDPGTGLIVTLICRLPD
jgi:hypothetical protein